MLRGGGYGQGYNDTRIEPITAEGKEVPKVCAPLRFTLLVFDLTTVRSYQSLNLLTGRTATSATPSDPTRSLSYRTPVMVERAFRSSVFVSNRNGGSASPYYLLLIPTTTFAVICFGTVILSSVIIGFGTRRAVSFEAQ